jgi:hypothetical protein
MRGVQLSTLQIWFCNYYYYNADSSIHACILKPLLYQGLDNYNPVVCENCSSAMPRIFGEGQQNPRDNQSETDAIIRIPSSSKRSTQEPFVEQSAATS